MSAESINIIYIAGAGRSGSTILNQVLGTVDGVSAFNELRALWRHGYVEKRPCSCGKVLLDCPFWSRALSKMSVMDSDVPRILQLVNAIDKSKYFFRMYASIQSTRFADMLEEYKKCLRSLYLTIAELTNNSIIVDSSKVPTRALILRELGFRVHVIHLVRDVRAVVYSWQKQMYHPGVGGTRKTYPAMRTILSWSMRNVLCELLSERLPYTRVLYEDIAHQPRNALQSLVERVGPLAGKTLPFADERSIRLHLPHAVAGSPHSYSNGVITLRPDDAWRMKQSPADRRLANTLAFPLLMRYGYPLRHYSENEENQ